MRWRTAHHRARRRRWRPVIAWIREVERILGAQRRGFRLIYRAPSGSKVRFVGSHGAVVAHSDRPPHFIKWDEAPEQKQEQSNG